MAWPREDEMSDGDIRNHVVGEITEPSNTPVAVNTAVS
jgi:hypothetical protein